MRGNVHLWSLIYDLAKLQVVTQPIAIRAMSVGNTNFKKTFFLSETGEESARASDACCALSWYPKAPGLGCHPQPRISRGDQL